MDELSTKLIGVSRATLYKYFPTKEMIIGFIVDNFIEFIHETTEINTISDLTIHFQQLFEQSILVIEYMTEIFITEVKLVYPEKFVDLNEALKKRNTEILSFHIEGIRHGIFNNINGVISIKQDEVLRNMLNVAFLMENNLTVKDVLSDYYTIKKIQLFKPDKLNLINDDLMTAKIDYLAHKITKNLI